MSISSISSASSMYDLSALMAQKKPEGDPEDLIANNDEDSNGALNIEEFIAMNSDAPDEIKIADEDIEDMFANLDANGDGEVTAEEIAEGRESMMQYLDSKYGSLDTMMQVNEILNETQETLVDLVNSSNGGDDDDDSDDPFDFLTNQYQYQIQQYLDQAELAKNGDASTDVLSSILGTSSISEYI